MSFLVQLNQYRNTCRFRKAHLGRIGGVDLTPDSMTNGEEFSCWASHFSAGILCVLQGKMVQRSAKRPAVRACWQFSDAPHKQNAPISGSEISGKAPAGQTCPCRAQPGNRSPLHIHSQQKRCGNTGLLTCVGERASLLRPHPAFSQVFPAMADFRPGGLMTASVWPHAHSTVSCRHNAFFLAAPAGGRQSGVYYGIYSVLGKRNGPLRMLL